MGDLPSHGGRIRPDSLAGTILLTALVATGSLSVSIYTPSMPALAADFHTRPAMVKLTLSLFLIGFAVAQLVYGPLSDRFGRRPVLVAGLAVYVLGSVACVLAPTIEAMIAARFLQAVGACTGPVLGRAVVRDVHGREGTARILAWIGAAVTLSPAIGPTLGGSIHVWFGWRANFALLAVFGMILLATAWRLLGETNRQLDPGAVRLAPMAGNYRRLLTDRLYLGYMLSGSCIYGGLYAWIAAAPFLFVERLHFSPDRYGALTIVTTGCYIGGSVTAARLTQRAGLDRMILIGCLLAVAGAALMMLFAMYARLSAVSLIGPMMLFSFGMGLILANALAGGLLPFPHMAGAASALLGFAQMGLAALGTGLVASLPQLSAGAMSSVILVLAGTALVSHVALIGRRTR
jgi:DHA1 family bicyclomycin/chloramphenicol resistance-like MFS transporter